MKEAFIRNFAIISHVDHGKSTLADCLLEMTGAIPPLKMRPRVLDNMELERERGVTIKLKAVRMAYQTSGRRYTLNLIDTPGHMDFSYEVSRSLAACEGVVLLVDASQGIQAQTLANYEKAKSLNLVFVPVVSKVDLPNAAPEKVAAEIGATFGFPRREVIFASAKRKTGIGEVLEAIVERIPPPAGDPRSPLRALIFDSKYDEHQGVIAFVRVVDGELKKAGRIEFLGTGARAAAVEVGYLTPEMAAVDRLSAGEVGYIATGLKALSKVRVGDTIVEAVKRSKVEPLAGYKVPRPMAFATFYPVGATDFDRLREALAKLSLTDASFSFRPESSGLGRGFSCGFLGMFHAEIVRERLKREYRLDLVMSRPTVAYKVFDKKGSLSVVERAEDFPDAGRVREVKEPWIVGKIFSPAPFLGAVMRLCQQRRGIHRRRRHWGEKVELVYELPFAEMLCDFFDRLKSVSSGFASLEWEFLEYRPVEATRLDILVHGARIPSLARVVLRRESVKVGKALVKRLREVLPRQQFPVAVQAAVGGRIVARETLPARRKNVLAKLSGGHRERKDKVLERQRRGKKRLAKIGKVAVPQEVLWSLS